MHSETPRRRVFGRRLGRPLNAARKDVLETLLPQLRITLPDTPHPASGTVSPSAKPALSHPLPTGEGYDGELCRVAAKPTELGEGEIYPPSLYPSPKSQYWLEIGFGNGEHLAAMMARYPERGYIGAEPFINGMAAFLKAIKDGPCDNIRVWMDDALLLVGALAAGSLDGIYILNPDPWPKKRHHKRRIVRPETLDAYARVLKPGGKLIMTTDVDDLAQWMVTQASNHPAFEWSAERSDDWRTPPPEWVATRYEAKGAAAGRSQTYLLFERK